MKYFERSPLKRRAATTAIFVGGLFLLHDIFEHRDAGLADFKPVTAYEQTHPHAELPPDLKQMQDSGYEQAAWAIGELVVDAGLVVLDWRIMKNRQQ